MDNNTLLILIIVAAAVGYALHAGLIIIPELTKSETESFVPVGPIHPNGTPASAYYGEEHPINAYQSTLQRCGKNMPDMAEAERIDQVYRQGVLTADDQASNYFYVRSNAGRYPIQQASDHTELRTTRNPYKAGTRAMRAVQIRPDESVVPDKIERTVAPY